MLFLVIGHHHRLCIPVWIPFLIGVNCGFEGIFPLVEIIHPFGVEIPLVEGDNDPGVFGFPFDGNQFKDVGIIRRFQKSWYIPVTVRLRLHVLVRKVSPRKLLALGQQRDLGGLAERGEIKPHDIAGQRQGGCPRLLLRLGIPVEPVIPPLLLHLGLPLLVFLILSVEQDLDRGLLVLWRQHQIVHLLKQFVGILGPGHGRDQ